MMVAWTRVGVVFGERVSAVERRLDRIATGPPWGRMDTMDERDAQGECQTSSFMSGDILHQLRSIQ